MYTYVIAYTIYIYCCINVWVYQKDRRRPSKHHAARVVIGVYTNYTHGRGNDLIRHNDDDCVCRVLNICAFIILLL